MTNPVAQIRMVHISTPDGSKPIYKQVDTYCPGCYQLHPFTVEVYDGYTRDGKPVPVWQWDGNLESPTFNPSMLAYSTVHLCSPEYVHVEECLDEGCGHVGHGVYWKFADGRLEPVHFKDIPPDGAVRVRVTNKPHIVDPAWGNCHSFLHNGRWQFLSDSAHSLAGQTVDMVSLPDYLVKE